MATILVVDDLAANREVLVTLLRYRGHDVCEASNGVSALERAASERPALVITDVLMPVMDGYEFVRQLRADPVTRDMPVVFYTAHYGEREARTLAGAIGVAHVLTKPAEPEEVLRVVDMVLLGRPGDTASLMPVPEPQFDREHLRLLTDKLSEKAEDLRSANIRLRALINIGLELAGERDAVQLLRSVSVSARELFRATYVTLGTVEPVSGIVNEVVMCGIDPGDWLASGKPPPGVLKDVVSARRTVRGRNLGGAPGTLGLSHDHPAVQAYVIAPISSPINVYGWLCLVGNEGQEFTEEDEQLAVALSGQVGRIYENGYFYRIAQRRAEQLEREVIERQRGEVLLRQERDRAQRYLDTAEVMLLALDTDGRIVLVNRYACDVLGWSAAELIGRDWFETCLPVAFRDALRERFTHLLGGDLSLAENAVVSRAGIERLVEWRNTLVRDEAGVVVGTFSSGTDITERVRAAEALRKAEERMRFALENADVGIWDVDYASGNLVWSEVLERHYGFAPGTFSGKLDTFLGCVHPDDRDSVALKVEAAMKEGRDFWLQHRVVWPDGTVRWLNAAGRILLDAAGKPVRGVGISLDVTERHALEARYQQAQKMDAIGRLAGGIAHDFNNLLTAILGYCELLREDLPAGGTMLADVEEIHRAGTSAALLTKQLLAFSRKQIVAPELIDVNTAVRDMRAMLDRLIGADIKVSQTLCGDSRHVLADRGQIEQIILNLVLNARDAMPRGGVLTIETDSVQLDEGYSRTHFDVAPGRYVALSVTDTGSGMTPEVQARLFEPFFTTKDPGKGTGLGLATVHGIVSRCGGCINVYSEVGHGTVFSVYLPAHDSVDAPVAAPADSAVLAVLTCTVLVVDDAPGVRELARRFLQRRGDTVVVAADASEALDIFAATPAINVLLTDVVMPGASGPALAQQLQQRRPSLKVIFMSGYTEDAIVQRGILNEGVVFLHKPFSSESLSRRIREVLAP